MLLWFVLPLWADMVRWLLDVLDSVVSGWVLFCSMDGSPVSGFPSGWSEFAVARSIVSAWILICSRASLVIRDCTGC